jgi:hypothetical protein
VHLSDIFRVTGCTPLTQQTKVGTKYPKAKVPSPLVVPSMTPLSTRPNRWRLITVFNLLVGLLFSLSALAQPAFLKEGLVAYYPFNGNANDESGNGNNGLILGDVKYAGDRFEKSISALSFNGQFGGVAINGIQDSDINGGFTVSCWILLNNSSSGDWLDIFSSKWYGKFGLMYYPDARRFSAYREKGGLQETAVYVWGNGLSQKWYHIVLTESNLSQVLYVDGVKIGEYKSVNEPELDSDSLLIGISNANLDAQGFQYVFNGRIDEFRFYKNGLTEAEVKALYSFESKPKPPEPFPATATAQVVNGFVVGATITGAGYGYVENPVVSITGGGGTGAKAAATQFNGVVTSITITNPGSGYTSTPTITIAPPPFPPRKATSTAQIVNGFVVGTKITDGGFGYDSPPAVLLVGGGGSGATAVATVANGVVTAITITNPGTGYTSAPVVRIASPPFAPKLGIETSKVYVRMSVVLGRKYQLEASTDLNTWTTTGPAFIAQDEELVQEFDVNQVGRYFRINQVP